MLKVLVLAHGHPDISKGGGEIAALQLFQQLKHQSVDATFLAAHYDGSLAHGGTLFSAYDVDQVLMLSTMKDYFHIVQHDVPNTVRGFIELLDSLQPDIIHFHHYLHLGLHMIAAADAYRRDRRRKVVLAMTLHDFYAVCPHRGLLTTPAGRLCQGPGYTRCAKCLHTSSEEVFLRSHRIASSLSRVDLFISPSQFLASKMKEFGFSAPIHVIENGQVRREALPPRELAVGGTRNRFAFLGQIGEFKGVDVLLSAARRLDADGLDIRVDVYGSGLDGLPEPKRTSIQALLSELERVAVMHGEYGPHDLASIFQNTDWLVVPSVWWENSPLVIQEAFNFGRPVICSDIGGMAEKVRHGVDGLHFRYGSDIDLARTMAKATSDATWQQVHSQIRRPPTIEDTTSMVLSLYQKALNGESET